MCEGEGKEVMIGWIRKKEGGDNWMREEEVTG